MFIIFPFLNLYPFHIFHYFPTLNYFPFSIKYFPTYFHTIPKEAGKPSALAVGASSINAFKGWLSKIRETRMGYTYFMD